VVPSIFRAASSGTGPAVHHFVKRTGAGLRCPLAPPRPDVHASQPSIAWQHCAPIWPMGRGAGGGERAIAGTGAPQARWSHRNGAPSYSLAGAAIKVGCAVETAGGQDAPFATRCDDLPVRWSDDRCFDRVGLGVGVGPPLPIAAMRRPSFSATSATCKDTRKWSTNQRVSVITVSTTQPNFAPRDLRLAHRVTRSPCPPPAGTSTSSPIGRSDHVRPSMIQNRVSQPVAPVAPVVGPYRCGCIFRAGSVWVIGVPFLEAP